MNGLFLLLKIFPVDKTCYPQNNFLAGQLLAICLKLLWWIYNGYIKKIRVQCREVESQLAYVCESNISQIQ